MSESGNERGLDAALQDEVEGLARRLADADVAPYPKNIADLSYIAAAAIDLARRLSQPQVSEQDRRDAERWREVERNPFVAADRIFAAVDSHKPSATWAPALRAAFDAAIAKEGAK